MKYLLSLYFIIIAAAQIAPAQATADPPTVYLAEGQDPGAIVTTTTSTTSTKRQHFLLSRDVPMALQVRKQARSPGTTTGPLTRKVSAMT